MPSSRPIQQNPWGLLGYLQLKNMGHNPVELLDSVQPTLDLWRHYLQNDAETILSANIPITGTGGMFPPAGEAQVPNGECWAVHHFSASQNGVLAAGQSLSFMTMIEYGLSGGGGGVGVGTGQMSRVYVAGEGAHCTSDIPGGYLLLPPTSQLIVWCSTVVLAAGAINANIRAHFTRLPL